MNPFTPTVSLLAFGLAGGALAQSAETYLVQPGSFGTAASVQRLELAAGGVLAGPRLVSPWFDRLRDLASVGNELWAATVQDLQRLDPTTLQSLGVLIDDFAGNAIVPLAGGGALAFGFDRIALTHVAVQLDPTGVEVARTPTGTAVRHAMAYAGGFLIIRGGSVERLDAALNVLGVFAPNAPALAAQSQLSYTPERLTPLDGGRVAIACGTFFITTDAVGLADRLWDVGLFETSALSTGAGDLLVADANGLLLLDPVTGGVSTVLEGPFAGSYLSAPMAATAPLSSSRFCPAPANSSGRAAAISLLASDDVDDQRLQLFVRGLPPGALTLPIYGRVAGSTPFGNGTLCVAPIGGIARSAFGPAGADGVHRVIFDFVTAGLGSELLAGTTWNFQAVYRDSLGVGFSTTDAVALTFQP